MEFGKKLQQLRKEKDLTQEALASRLYVSRTAISKWESGRGYPSIDSLRAIAQCFSVTVDELLSPDELLTVAKEDQRQTERHFRDMVFGLLDVCMALLLFLPLFAVKTGDVIREASLLYLDGAARYLKIAYFVIVLGSVIWGIATLTLQSCEAPLWIKSKTKISLALGVSSVLLFMISLQPYAAVLAFSLLAFKALMLIKRA